jgi:two-component system, OmpR family, sensor histidine kinase KdpD
VAGESSRSLPGYVAGAAAIGAATMAGHALFRREDLADVLMLYLLGILLVAMRWSIVPAVATAVASVLCFDWFFVPPYHTLAVASPHHLVTFSVVVLIAVIVNRLTERVHVQASERARLADEAHAAKLTVEAERLRSSLLSSVSHDLRTPLAVITGTATTLTDERLEPAVRRDLVDTIVSEAERLERLVRNLLDMTRVEARVMPVQKEWQPLEEVVGASLASVERLLGSRPVLVDVPRDLAAPYDAVLLQQVLVNLVENAVKYAPESPVEIRAAAAGGAAEEIEVVVADRGPGLPPGDEVHVFEKFYRGKVGRASGIGLGLTICNAIVVAHGGRIWACNREGGGSAFHFTLPLEGEPPVVEPEAAA